MGFSERFCAATLRLCALTLTAPFFLPLPRQPTEKFAEQRAEGDQTTAPGRLAGRVSVAGHLPHPKPLKVFKSRAYCGPTVPNETLLFSADGGLRNAVVILRDIEARPQARPGKLVLDNQRCAFAPHVQVTPLGSELLLKNSDPILHAVHARLGTETLFNVGLPRWRQVTKRLDRLGVIKINCDVLHTWMTAAVVVTDSPYFAITDERGDFAIEGLPPGSYDVEIWHERFGFQRRKFQLHDGGASDLQVIYSVNKLW